MGNSPYAKLAWGIDLGDPENTEEGFDWDDADISPYDFEEEVMPGLFGFTEEPPEWPSDVKRGTPQAQEWWKANYEPYYQRLDAAIPLKFESYGYERGGKALVLKRSLTSVEWEAETVDPATLAAPTPEDLASFRVVLDRLNYDGEVKLLLMAAYG
jgi:hypothetical protein